MRIEFKCVFILLLLNIYGFSALNITVNKEFAVISLQSLLPDDGIEVDDGDGNDDTKKFIASKNSSGEITVTATPNILLTENSVPSSWVMTNGDGTGKLTRTINRSDVKETVVECRLGTTTKTTTISIMGVGSLTPSEGVLIDDGDGDDNTSTYLVQKASAGLITVTASSDPVLQESELPSFWELTGGTVTGKLTRTIDKSVAAETVIECKMGSDAKKITVCVFEVKPEQIAFNGTNCDILNDDRTVPYEAPHWKDNSTVPDGDADDFSDRKYPVSFTRNTKMSLSAVFNTTPLPSYVNVLVRGQCSDGNSFDSATATFANNQISTSTISTVNAFPNEVDYFDLMEISWEMSFDNGNNWITTGQTQNQMYVTLGDPIIDLKTPSIIHTAIHLSTTNADGTSNENACVNAVWDEFKDRRVYRIDGKPLTYYQSFKCENTWSGDLIKYKDGQCGAWASLFLDMLKIQHIQTPDNYIVFDSKIASDEGFLIKNWKFTGAGNSGDSEYPYLNVLDSNIVTNNPDYPHINEAGTAYQWLYSEVKDQGGIPGQSNSNPASVLNNHQEVVYKGEYFDPSYGTRYSSLDEIDDNSIAGYYKIVEEYPVSEANIDFDLNGDGDKKDTVPCYVFLIRKNTEAPDLKEDPRDY